jgi:general secretion pathway protein F
MQFNLKILRGSQIEMLSLEAANLDLALQQAEQDGCTVLGIESGRSILISFGSRRAKFNLNLFSQELLALLESGLSLVEAIEGLSEKEGQEEFRRVLEPLLQSLYQGLPLSTAMERQSDVFPALYVALIRSTERTGDLVHALSRHVSYQTQVDAVRKKMLTASIYPALLMVVGALVLLFLLGYVVPKFSGIYESTGKDLPWLSKLLLTWGKFLHGHSVEFTVSCVLILASGIFILSRQQVRETIALRLWGLPVIGETMRIYQLARFYHTLGMLLRGGIPLVTGLKMVSPLLHPLLRTKCAQAEKEISEGKPISQVMSFYGMTTSISLRMLRVGERTGRMGEMMERIGLFYDDEISRAVDWFTRLLEPVLMIFIGMVIGTVVVLMYMPIFDLAGSVQ